MFRLLQQPQTQRPINVIAGGLILMTKKTTIRMANRPNLKRKRTQQRFNLHPTLPKDQDILRHILPKPTFEIRHQHLQSPPILYERNEE